MDSPGKMVLVRADGGGPDFVESSRLLRVLPPPLSAWLASKSEALPRIVFQNCDVWRINSTLRLADLWNIRMTYTEARELGVVITCMDTGLAADVLTLMTTVAGQSDSLVLVPSVGLVPG